MRFPLSETLEYSVASPVLEKAAVRKHEFTVPLPAPRYWQSRHQHTRVTIGNSELVQRTDPQGSLLAGTSSMQVEKMPAVREK